MVVTLGCPYGGIGSTPAQGAQLLVLVGAASSYSLSRLGGLVLELAASFLAFLKHLLQDEKGLDYK